MTQNNSKKSDANKSIYDEKIIIPNMPDSFDEALKKILSTPNEEVDRINKKVDAEYIKQTKKEDRK